MVRLGDPVERSQYVELEGVSMDMVKTQSCTRFANNCLLNIMETSVCESTLSTGEKLLMLFGGDLLPLWPLLVFESCISEDSGSLRRKNLLAKFSLGPQLPHHEENHKCV